MEDIARHVHPLSGNHNPHCHIQVSEKPWIKGTCHRSFNPAFHQLDDVERHTDRYMINVCVCVCLYVRKRDVDIVITLMEHTFK